jgi:hypothetical protein
MSKSRRKLIYKLVYKLIKHIPTSRLRRCPYFLNLVAKLEENSKKTKGKLDLAYVLPTHKLEEEGRPYHFPLHFKLEQSNK